MTEGYDTDFLRAPRASIEHVARDSRQQLRALPSALVATRVSATKVWAALATNPS